MQDGSKGVIRETEADNITATANGFGLTPSEFAVRMAIGRTTKAAAAFDIGWVRKTVRMIKPAMMASSPMGAI